MNYEFEPFQIGKFPITQTRAASREEASGKPDILEAALKYYEKGFAPIPIAPNSKKPLAQWKAYQTRRPTEEEIITLFTRFRDADIGIVTGKRHNLFVLDCDSQEAYESLQALLPDSLTLPVVKTPRGYHLYFSYPKNIDLTVGVDIMQGVDYRGEGGYVIAPPSKKGTYKWIVDLNTERPALPPAIINNFINSNVYMKCASQSEKKEVTQVTQVTKVTNLFKEGRRDNDLFHTINCLIRGGCDPEFASQVGEILAKNSTPPFPESEIKAKIQSAIKRDYCRSENIAGDFRAWIEVTSGHFLVTDYLRESQRSQKEAHAVIVEAGRLCKAGIIEKYGDRRGSYRKVENEAEPVNFLDAPVDEFSLHIPLGVHDFTKLYAGNIAVIAGTKSTGKTALLLNIVKENQHRHEIIYLNSEMGDIEFRKRLELFDDVSLHDWKFKPYHRAGNFSDLVTAEKKIFIIDFLEVTEDFWKVAKQIQEIHNKLKEGIAIIALQKSAGKPLGRGGDFSMEKARLYLTLDFLPEEKRNRLKIVDAKSWRTDLNPRGMFIDYKLVHGSRFIPVTDWQE